MKPLVIALSEGGCAGREGGGDLNNVRLLKIVTMNPLCATNIS
jgi:hypothetical protein